MAYKVVITPPAKYQLEMYISHTIDVFKNKKAALSIKNDAKETKKRLSYVAGSLPLCEDSLLAHYGYRRVSFSKHNFFMLYRIDGNIVSVDAMYHELQDYESLFIKDLI